MSGTGFRLHRRFSGVPGEIPFFFSECSEHVGDGIPAPSAIFGLKCLKCPKICNALREKSQKSEKAAKFEISARKPLALYQKKDKKKRTNKKKTIERKFKMDTLYTLKSI